MDKSQEAEEAALPSYEHEGVPSYEEAPSYDSNITAGKRQGLSPGINLTLDRTGIFIKILPASDAPPLYTLSASLLHVNSRSSIHVKRPLSQEVDASPVDIYAIGEHFISPMLPMHNKDLRHVTAARSHGFLVSVNLREKIWDFTTQVKGDGKDVITAGSYRYPTDPVYMIGTGPGPGTVQKHLLQLVRGKWVNDADEVVALEREGGAECEGMPVLSVTKELDKEMMDFLVSAWLVTMWGEVGKRARRLSRSASGSKMGNGKFKLGG
jgi:hypothetical protein